MVFSITPFFHSPAAFRLKNRSVLCGLLLHLLVSALQLADGHLIGYPFLTLCL